MEPRVQRTAVDAPPSVQRRSIRAPLALGRLPAQTISTHFLPSNGRSHAPHQRLIAGIQAVVGLPDLIELVVPSLMHPVINDGIR